MKARLTAAKTTRTISTTKKVEPMIKPINLNITREKINTKRAARGVNNPNTRITMKTMEMAASQ